MKKKTLYQVIYEDIAKAIETGVYKVGDKLPSEKELATQYGVSMITSKRALEMLVEDHQIVRMPGLGSFVIDRKNEIIDTDKPTTDRILNQYKEKEVISVIFDSFSSIYGTKILRSIERECKKNDWIMQFCCTEGDLESEKQAIEESIRAGVSGIIIMCVQGELFNESILRCSIDGFPVVLLDRTMEGIPVACVTTDNYKAAKELTDSLFLKGCKKICFASHSFHDTSTIKERLRGFVESNLEHEVIVKESDKLLNMRCNTADNIEDESFEDEKRVRQYIEENKEVDAFFAVQYDLGVQIYKVLKKINLEKKIRVAVFDGPEEKIIPESIFDRAVQDEQGMGIEAVKLLKDKINGSSSFEKVQLPYKIMIADNKEMDQ